MSNDRTHPLRTAMAPPQQVMLTRTTVPFLPNYLTAF